MLYVSRACQLHFSGRLMLLALRTISQLRLHNERGCMLAGVLSQPGTAEEVLEQVQASLQCHIAF